jgi:hypothetical protein
MCNHKTGGLILYIFVIIIQYTLERDDMFKSNFLVLNSQGKSYCKSNAKSTNDERS